MRLMFWKKSDKAGVSPAQPPLPRRQRRQAPRLWCRRRRARCESRAMRQPCAEPAGALGDLDLRLVWQALLRNKAWIIVPTAVAAALSFAVVNVITPRYKSEARILVDNRENVFLRPNADRVEERRELDPEAITSQVQIVLSRDLAREIIRKNRLNERPEFDPVLQGLSPLRALMAMVGIGRDPLKLSAEERVLEAFYDRLTAYAVDKSRVIVDRIPVARSRACRARRQLDRRRLPRDAAGRASRTRPARPGSGSRARSTTCARRSPRPRRGSRISAARRACSSAPTTPRCRTSRWARSTPSSATRGRRSRMPNPRRG